MSREEFVQLYEKPGIPVVITGLQDAWQASKLWNKADLAQRFAEHKFKVRIRLLHSYSRSTGAPFWHSMHMHAVGTVPAQSVLASPFHD